MSEQVGQEEAAASGEHDAESVKTTEQQFEEMLERRAAEADKMRAKMSDVDQASIAELWRRVGLRQDCFAHAKLTMAFTMEAYGRGTLSYRPRCRYEIGTRVLVVMASRLGDVGIRMRHVDRIENGYELRVVPEILTDWVFVVKNPVVQQGESV